MIYLDMKTVILILVTLMAGCDMRESAPIHQKSNTYDTLMATSEEFDLFYIKFYQDSIFQISRICFPVGGVIKYWNENNDPNIIIEKWQESKMPIISSKETLLKHYNNIESSITKADSMVIEKHWIENSGFSIERRYKLIYNKWYLVYYDLFNL